MLHLIMDQQSLNINEDTQICSFDISKMHTNILTKKNHQHNTNPIKTP
jgi:hypothetical protein